MPPSPFLHSSSHDKNRKQLQVQFLTSTPFYTRTTVPKVANILESKNG